MNDDLNVCRGVRNAILLSIPLWLLLLWAGSAFATKVQPPPEPAAEQDQSQQQGQAQGQQQGMAQGQGQSQNAAQSAVVDASSSVTTQLTSNPGLSNVTSPSYSNRETSVAIGNTAVIPAQVTDCFRPKNKMGRGWRFLFGAVEVSATVELDQACVAAKAIETQNELDRISLEIRLIEAQNEAERLRIERIRLEQGQQK